MQFFAVTAGIMLMTACSPAGDENMVLRYDEPSEIWEDALPIGNGHIGAMVFGGVDTERLQLNDDTLYSGEPSTAWKGTDIRPTYDKILSLMKEGKTREAQEIVRSQWLGALHQNYQPMTDLYLDNLVQGEVSGYLRTLDISKAVSRVSYTQNGVAYKREVIASHPDDAIVLRISADKKGSISFGARFGSLHPTAVQSAEGNTTLVMKGQAPGYAERRSFDELEAWGAAYRHPYLFDENGKRKVSSTVLYGEDCDNMGMFFDSRIKVDAKGGTVTSGADGLKVEGADEVVIYLTAATSYNGWDKSPSREGVDASAKAAATLEKASAYSWKQAYARHEEDYCSLFGRMTLDLTPGQAPCMKMTDERIASFMEDNDASLCTLLYQYGRYLLISGSRPGGQPLNLQGMWNDKIIPPWNGAYTNNINTEMNYWFSETTNLSECTEPLFTLIKETAKSGEETARNMYGLHGWMGHHNVSIWRETSANDNGVCSSYWPMVGGWLSSHMWEHWLFTGDEKFLRDEAYPVMKGAAIFFKEWLIEREDGLLVTPVSTSPENTYINEKGEPCQIDQGSTMDMSIIRELFTRTAAAAGILGIDGDFKAELEGLLPRLLPYQTGSKGQLQEWSKDYRDYEPQHRHLSHLYGFYPGDQINWVQTPELVKAVQNSLAIRGDEACGWSMGWKVNIWARMLDGDHAYKIVKNMLRPLFDGGNGSLYRDLLNGAPYQIDGNVGFTSGLTEMMIQSHQGFVHLLPALPSVWPEGSVNGLCARGGFECSMQWKDGAMCGATVKSVLGRECTLVAPVPFKVAGITAEPYELAGRIWYKAAFDTEAGKTYKLVI